MLNDFQQKFETAVKQSLKTASMFFSKKDPDMSDDTMIEQFRLVNQWMKTTTSSLRDLQTKFETTMNED